MVTIKVTKAEDIIKAYLLTMGYEKADEALVKALMQKVNLEGLIIKQLDDVIFSMASKVYKGSNLEKEQLVGWFKACFIMNNGAKEFKKDLELSPNFVEKMQSNFPNIAPLSTPTHMLAQTIESHNPKSLFKKVFKKWF